MCVCVTMSTTYFNCNQIVFFYCRCIGLCKSWVISKIVRTSLLLSLSLSLCPEKATSVALLIELVVCKCSNIVYFVFILL